MSGMHEPFDELAAGFALGALDPADAREFERHLAEGCDECGRAVLAYREALACVAADNGEAPPPRVRDVLLERLGTPAALGGGVRIVLGWAATAALAAGIAAVVTANMVGTRYQSRLDALAREAASLRADLAAQVETVGALRHQLDEQDRTLTMVRAESAEQGRTLALLADPATRVVALAGLPPSPSAQARMIWHPRDGGLLLAADLPPAPAGKVYELWAIAAGKPLPAGLFTVDARGRGTVKVAPIEGVTSVDVFAVTLEPEGGVPAPTGAMFLASKSA